MNAQERQSNLDLIMDVLEMPEEDAEYFLNTLIERGKDEGCSLCNYPSPSIVTYEKRKRFFSLVCEPCALYLCKAVYTISGFRYFTHTRKKK